MADVVPQAGELVVDPREPSGLEVGGRTTAAAERFVAALEGGGTRPLASRLGWVRTAHATAGGKAMLAFCSPADLAHRCPGRNLARVTDRTITDWNSLTRQLETVRARGRATSGGESDRAVNGLAAPIMPPSGESVASVSVAAFAPRLSTRSQILEVVGPLADAASRIERELRGGPISP
ncbi:IclR family transcriptional regulator [Streptomyces sp. NPDC013157]|uniref:IclR family transcriptional regulator n=1 Tax=Streptomyces sp. NPDC013157 TaxID=3364861 RepID=UPI003691AE51